MTRMIREFVDVPNHVSLDALIDALAEIREALPPGANPEVRMRGDDVFGRKLSISYTRPQTLAEKASDQRCRESYLERRRHLSRLEWGEDRADDLDRAA